MKLGTRTNDGGLKLDRAEREWLEELLPRLRQLHGQCLIDAMTLRHGDAHGVRSYTLEYVRDKVAHEAARLCTLGWEYQGGNELHRGTLWVVKGQVVAPPHAKLANCVLEDTSTARL